LTFLLCFLCSFLFGQPAKDTLTTLSHFEFPYPYWSPDGKEIVFQSNLTGKWQLYKRDMTTKEIVRLMENKANEVTPAWSPDGTKILFTSDRDDDEEIFVLHLKNKEVKQLTHNDSRDIHPNWSPDGKKIVFNSARKQDNPEKLFIQTI
jgi:TolB protein